MVIESENSVDIIADEQAAEDIEQTPPLNYLMQTPNDREMMPSTLISKNESDRSHEVKGFEH
jgi:hypothetical protein